MAAETAGAGGGSAIGWGVISTAGIAHKIYVASKEVDNATIVAGSSRSAEKAKAWADERGIPESHGEYDALLANPKVKVVYNPLPTGIRSEWSIKAAQAGKHVLSEKPAAPSAAELEKVLAACKENGVQFMDGVMFMHHERLNKMREVFSDAEGFGTVRRVTTHFSFFAPPEFRASDIRFKKDMEPAGALGDLGWYNIRFSLYAFGYELPERVECTVHERVNGVPIDATGVLYFSGGRIAQFDVSFSAVFRQTAEICGEKARVSLDDFTVAEGPEKVSFKVDRNCGLGGGAAMDRTTTETEVIEVLGCRQEGKMLERLSSIAASGTVDNFWPEVAMKTQRVLDACVASGEAEGRSVAL